MSANNQMYKFYSEMTKGYREGEDGLFEHGVRSWMSMDPENPFKQDTPEYECFFKMQRGYQLWMMNGADKKINRRRMIEAAKELCEINPKRPYKFNKEENEEDKRQAEAYAKEQAALAEETAKAEAEEEEKNMFYVFGVVPQKKKDKETDELKISRLRNLFKRNHD